MTVSFDFGSPRSLSEVALPRVSRRPTDSELEGSFRCHWGFVWPQRGLDSCARLGDWLSLGPVREGVRDE